MLIMDAGAARAHKLMVAEQADAVHVTGPCGHGDDLGFRLIPEWNFSSSQENNVFSFNVSQFFFP